MIRNQKLRSVEDRKHRAITMTYEAQEYDQQWYTVISHNALNNSQHNETQICYILCKAIN